MFPERFKSLIVAKEAAFLCKIAAARTSTKRHVVPIKFNLHKGLGSQASRLLDEVGLVANRDLAQFYSVCNGATLFASTVTDQYPLEIYRLKSIPARTRAMRRWFQVNDLPELEQIEDPFGLRTAVAVGGSPNSSSYLAVAVEGPYAGSVFQVDHGGLPNGPLASSFSELLERAAEDPIAFLDASASYPRYSDGESAILWQPIEFSLLGNFS